LNNKPAPKANKIHAIRGVECGRDIAPNSTWPEAPRHFDRSGEISSRVVPGCNSGQMTSQFVFISARAAVLLCTKQARPIAARFLHSGLRPSVEMTRCAATVFRPHPAGVLYRYSAAEILPSGWQRQAQLGDGLITQPDDPIAKAYGLDAATRALIQSIGQS
jgi:hypothetical protein